MKTLALLFFFVISSFAITPYSLENVKEVNLKILNKKETISKELEEKIENKIKEEFKKLGIKTTTENYSNFLVKIKIDKIQNIDFVRTSIFITEDIIPLRDKSLETIAITYKNAKESIVTPLRSLPAHTDVLPGLKKLSESGFGIVSLTNSSAKGVETQFKNAGLTKYFDNRYTIETIQKYKPHLDTYAMVIKDLGLKPEEVLMVAAHAWDLAGAKKAGLQTAFIKRPGKVLYPNVEKPDYVVKDLTELVKIFQEKGYFKIDY